MSYTVKLLPKVHQEMQAANKWYNNQLEGLGNDFKLAVTKEIDYIREFPRHYQTKYKELRQALVNRFPYAIFYLVEEGKKEVVIFGVMHTSRDPENIRKRRK